MIWDWLTSNGLVIFQLIQLVIFFVLIWMIVRFERQATAERQNTINELKRSAEELSVKTDEIAAEVKKDATQRAIRVTEDIERLSRLFDQVGVRQEEMKEAVKSVEDVVHRELNRSHSTKTTREKIDEISDVTKSIADKLEDKKDANS